MFPNLQCLLLNHLFTHGVSILCGVFVDQRSRTQPTIDSIKIFNTPRKLIHSLQDSGDLTLGCSKKQNRTFKSLSSGNIEWSPASKYDQNGFSNDVKCDSEVIESCAEVEFQGGSESVSSTDDLLGDASKQQMSTKVVPENRIFTPTALQKTKYKLVCGLSFVLLAVATPLLWINSQDEGHYLVPT